MAYSSSFHFLLFCSLLFPIISISTAKTTSFRPKALVLPVTKDASTNQYLVRIKQRSPLVPVKLTVDLGGELLLVDCEKDYVSSSYKSARCGSAECNLAPLKSCGECFSPAKPGCNNNTCGVFHYNPYTTSSTVGELESDVVSLQSTNGINPGRAVSAPKVLFTCSSTFFLRALASGVTGIAGLGRKKIGLPLQFAAAFSFNRKFAVCLSSSTRSKGVIFFGNEPYGFLPNIKFVSKDLTYTPLILNPVSALGSFIKGETSADYFIGVKSIKINDKVVPLNTTLLSIDKSGNGGTKISTVERYTVLQTPIYDAVVNAFVKALSKVPRVAAVEPFGVCYSSKSLGSTRLGPGVPSIDLVLQSEKVVWRIFGANSMVQVSEDVLCLGFVDSGLFGGGEPRTSIVIGGHQIEDNLLQFDLAASRLGFSNTLLGRQTTCANFNFTSNA